MSFSPGEPAPWFYGSTEANPRYRFDSVAGRIVVLSMFGSAGRPEGKAIVEGLSRLRERFDDSRILFFGVTIDPDDDRLGRIRDQVPGIRFFRDYDRTISRLYGALPGGSRTQLESIGPDIPRSSSDHPDASETAAALKDYQPFSLILDERLRVLAFCRFDEPALHIERIVAYIDRQPVAPEPSRAAAQAPVLTVPRVFEPDFCRKLIDLYHEHGGEDSGFMRDEGGKTVGVIDYSHKRRADYTIEDETIRAQCMHRIHDRLVPEIEKAFQFRATRMERYTVACYEAETGGHFRAHRDNTTKGTAHRRFAVSLHLNPDEYEGGDLRFPEFGPQLYRAPTGGAVVFSCSLLHEATPTQRGSRFVFLPFLYDDAAARLRDANAGFIADSVTRPKGTILPDTETAS
jgi:hypothetical protein